MRILGGFIDGKIILKGWIKTKTGLSPILFNESSTVLTTPPNNNSNP